MLVDTFSANLTSEDNMGRTAMNLLTLRNKSLRPENGDRVSAKMSLISSINSGEFAPSSSRVEDTQVEDGEEWHAMEQDSRPSTGSSEEELAALTSDLLPPSISSIRYNALCLQELYLFAVLVF